MGGNAPEKNSSMQREQPFYVCKKHHILHVISCSEVHCERNWKYTTKDCVEGYNLQAPISYVREFSLREKILWRGE